MQKKSKIKALFFVFAILVTQVTTVLHAHRMSKSEVKKSTLLVFGTAIVVTPLEVACLIKLESSKDFLTILKTPELWLGSVTFAGVMSGLFYAFMSYDHIGAWFERINSHYDRIQSYPIYSNRYASDEIFCESVLKYGNAIIWQQMQTTRSGVFVQAGPDNIFTALLYLGIAACGLYYLYHNMDDPRSDLLLLYVTDALVKNRRTVIQVSNELNRLVEYLDRDEDDELIDKCHVLMNELKIMITEIEVCIARIVCTKQWFDHILNAEIVVNGTAGTKTIPIKFVDSIYESISYFDAQYDHHSNTREEQELKGRYIRFDLEEKITLRDWSTDFATY